MTNIKKQTHIEYLSSKGMFTVDCNRAIFTARELKILKKNGHGFAALTKGMILPLNPHQQQFIEVANMRQRPKTEYETAWFKYLKRKEIEVKFGLSLQHIPIPNDDPFYSRAMAKDLKRSMFKMIKENHRK